MRIAPIASRVMPPGLADLRQEPARLGAARPADREREPDRVAEIAAGTPRCGRGRRGRLGDLLGRRALAAPEADEGGGDLFGAETVEERRGELGLVAGRLGQRRMVEDAGVVARLHRLGRGRRAPVGDHLGAGEEALRLLELGGRDDQRRDALAPGAAGAAGAVQQRLGVGRQVGVDDEVEVRQVDAARGDVGRDADPGAAVAQRLQGVVALGLGELARQRHGGEAALRAGCACRWLTVRAGRAEDDAPCARRGSAAG